MRHQGKYKVKNPKKYRGDAHNVIYRSSWEKYAFKWCDETSDVKSWSSEEVIIPYLYEVDKRYHRYFVDLRIDFINGETWLIEIKPEKETKKPTSNMRTKRGLTEAMTYVKNMNKWYAAEDFAKNRGWKFVIWTEKNEPLKSMIPKSTRPLKPYKRKKR